jgi:probable DNA repair protein
MAIRRFNIAPLLPALHDGHTILTPNNRSVDGILREFANIKQSTSSKKKSWPRPPVYAIDIYIQQIWQIAAAQGIAPFYQVDLLDRFNEQLLWIEILQSSYDTYPLLNIEEAANSVARSYQFFKQWDVALQKETTHYKSAVDFQAFLKWSEKFEILCAERRISSLSDASSIIISNINSLKELFPSQIVLHSFTQPPPLYSKLFDAFALVSEVCRLEETHDVSAQNIEQVLSVDNNSYMQFHDSNAELTACIKWCQDKAQEDKQAHVGIVMDPTRLLEPVLEELIFNLSLEDSNNKQNIDDFLNRFRSTEKLADTPAFSSAIALLKLNSEIIDAEHFCRILQSTSTISADKELQSRIALEAYLRKNIEKKIRLSNLRIIMQRNKKAYSCPILADALMRFSETARREKPKQTLQNWLKLFTLQLEILGWPGTNNTEKDANFRDKWQQCLQRLATSSGLLGNISISTALNKTTSFLKQNNSGLHFDSRKQISLVDIDEAQDLEFDATWVLGFDDRNWPSPANPVSFIPHSLQKRLSMPGSSNQQQLEVTLTQLIQLRNHTSKEFVVSYHAFEEELSIRPSGLIKNLEFSTPPADIGTPLKTENLNQLENFQDELYLPLREGENIRGGSSLLSNQSNCPFKAFARNRLHASKLEEFNNGLNPIARGQALHLALEKLGEEIRSSEELKQLSNNELNNIILRSIHSAIDFLRKKFPETMSPVFSNLEKNRLENLLRGFINLEKERSSFSVLSTEEKIDWEHSKLSLSFRIDRIDRIEDGSVLLIDYKTGKKVNYKWFDERPDDLQLPLYQIAVSENKDKSVSATLIFQLNIENIALFGTTDLEHLHPGTKSLTSLRGFSGTWPELQERWNKIIYSLIKEFESGLMSVAPTHGKQTCLYCDLQALCRINELEQQQLTSLKEEET